MSQDLWAGLVGKFADEAYATVKGYVRTFVMHRHLMQHLPPAPARVLDIGGGAGHQSFPLAAEGYEVTLLDSSPAMLDKARQRLGLYPGDIASRVAFVEADGRDAEEAVGHSRFDAVLSHGVLGYLDDPEPMIDQICRCARDGAVVSIMTGNARTTAVQPALEQRWVDALSAFDQRVGPGVLGVKGRADTVDEVAEMLWARGVEPMAWYGVWLFVDLLEFGGTKLDPADTEQVRAMAEVELEASRRDPYRQFSRVFHLLARQQLADPSSAS